MSLNNELFQLVYISTATAEYQISELNNILSVSRENNAREDITGMLLYHQGTFFQMLEGAESAVNAVMDRIKKDERHFGITVLLAHKITQRLLADWSMAYRDVVSTEAIVMEGFDSALREHQKSRLFNLEGLNSEARTLLSSFQRTALRK